MNIVIKWLEEFFHKIPLPFLEVWGRFGFLVGLFLMLAAYSRVTFRPGGRWGLGLEKQTWDIEAFLSMFVTLLLIIVTGYFGSFTVLVSGAQTFESLKDLSVFLCLLLFGYPALLVVPLAYGVSDLIEGVPPEYIKDWAIGYFINPACFWIAYQFIGKCPDFRRMKTWGWYALFVIMFMSIEPVLWGYICADKFTSEISYNYITPDLFFTTGLTWIIAPFAMLIIFPVISKMGLFWADIPLHVKERFIRSKEWIWESGHKKSNKEQMFSGVGLPLRMYLLVPLIILILSMVGATAYVTLSSSEKTAKKLATSLHHEMSENIYFQLKDHLENSGHNPVDKNEDVNKENISHLLYKLLDGKFGAAFIINSEKKLISSSRKSDDAFVNKVINEYKKLNLKVSKEKMIQQFSMDYITARPLSRETWLVQGTPYNGQDWILITVSPESYYLEGVRTGNSKSAMVFAVSLILSLILVAALASKVTAPVISIARASQLLADGETVTPIAGCHIEELNVLTNNFNDMSARLRHSIDDLKNEVKTRIERENELEKSEARLQLAVKAANLGVWDWDVVNGTYLWDESMYKLYNFKKGDFDNAYEAWIRSLHPEDSASAQAGVEAALRGEKELEQEFRVVWADGSIHSIRCLGQTIRDKDKKPLRMVGVNYDITNTKKV